MSGEDSSGTLFLTLDEFVEDVRATLPQAQSLMAHFLPFVNGTWSKFETKRKKKKIPESHITILRSKVYSYIGSEISKNNQVELCKSISRVVAGEPGYTSGFYGVQHALALFQLLQDRKLTETRVGYWLDQLLDGSSENIIDDKLEDVCQLLLTNLVNEFLVKKEKKVTVDSITETLGVNDATLSELGILILNTVAHKEVVESISPVFLNYKNFFPLKQLFVPICYRNKGLKMKEVTELLNFNLLECENSKGVHDARKGFVLLTVTDNDTLKRVAISCMLSNALDYFGNHPERHLEIQLVKDQYSGEICAQLWVGSYLKLSDIMMNIFTCAGSYINYLYKHTYALYLRMLLFINSRFVIPAGDSPNVFCSRELDLLYLAPLPTLTSEEDRTEESQVAKIHDILATYIFDHNLFDDYYNSQGEWPRVEEFEGLFDIHHIVNAEEIIREGASFIANVLGETEMLDEKKSFINFSQTKEEATATIKKLCQNRKHSVHYAFLKLND